MNVTIDKDAKDRLWAFIRAVKVEVGGMGYAFLQEDGSLHWNEVFLIPQEVTSSEVDFEKTNGDQHAIERAIEDGVLDDPNFVWVSWHSHHTMKPFWSSTDDKRIAAMRKVGVKRLLSLVGCHDGTYEMRLDVFGVKAHGVNIGQVTINSCSFAHEAQELSEFEKQIAAEVGEFVTERKYTSYALNGGSLLGPSYPSYSPVSKLADSQTDLAGSLDAPKDEMEKRRVVSELMEDEDLSRRDAEDLIDQLGIEQVEDMLWNRERMSS